MPSESLSPATNADSYETCRTHTDSVVKYYCRSHDQVGCGDCVFREHRTCAVESIVDVTKDVDTGRDGIDGSLKALRVKFTECQISMQDILKKNSEISEKALENLQTFRTELHECIESQHTEVKGAISSKTVEDERVLNGVLGECIDAVKEIGEMEEKLETPTDDKIKLFTIAKTVNKLRHKVKDLETTSTAAVRSSYTFKPTPVLTELLLNKVPFGTLENERIIVPAPVQDITNARLERLGDIECKGLAGGNSWITGMRSLTPSSLVITLYHTRVVAVVDVVTLKVQSHLQLSSQPWDVAVMPGNEIPLTLLYKQKIQILSYQNNTLSLRRDVKVNGQCCGIDYNGDRLVVSFDLPASVEIIDLQGHVLKRFTPNRSLLPWYAIFNTTGDKILVSNFNGNDKVTNLHVDGRETTGYELERVAARPERMHECGEGRFLVCGRESNSVHLVSKEGKVLRKMLTWQDGVRKPLTVVLSDNKDMLYVSTCDSNLKVFRLSYDV